MITTIQFLAEVEKLQNLAAELKEAMQDELYEAEEAHDEWENTPLEDGEYAYPEPETPALQEPIDMLGNLIDSIDDVIKVLK